MDMTLMSLNKTNLLGTLQFNNKLRTMHQDRRDTTDAYGDQPMTTEENEE